MYGPGLDSAVNEPTIIKHVWDNQDNSNNYQGTLDSGLPWWPVTVKNLPPMWETLV